MVSTGRLIDVSEMIIRDLRSVASGGPGLTTGSTGLSFTPGNRIESADAGGDDLVTGLDRRADRADLHVSGDAQAGFHRNEFGDGDAVLFLRHDEHGAARRAEDGGFRNDERVLHRAQDQRDVGEHAGLEKRRRVVDISLHQGGAGVLIDARGDEIHLAGDFLAGCGGRGAQRESAAGFEVRQVALRHLHLHLEARQIIHGGDDGLRGDEIADRERARAGDAIEGRGDRGLGEPHLQQVDGGLESRVLGHGGVHFESGNGVVFQQQLVAFEVLLREHEAGAGFGELGLEFAGVEFGEQLALFHGRALIEMDRDRSRRESPAAVPRFRWRRCCRRGRRFPASVIMVIGITSTGCSRSIGFGAPAGPADFFPPHETSASSADVRIR